MSIFWIDIETIPSESRPDHTEIAAPGNYKDPVKIEEYQKAAVDKVWREEALASSHGRLLCVAWAVGNVPPVCRGIWDKDEFGVLSDLNDAVQDVFSDERSITWGGFNLRGFDLNWIWHRAVKYDLPALMDTIKRDRFSKNVFDVRELWTGGDPYGKGRLKDIAAFLGIETMGMDGGEVFDLYLAGEFERIAEYCKQDVEITRAVAWRMGKGSPPIKPKTADPFLSAAG